MVSPGHSAPIDCWTSPVSARNWSMMIERIQVIGDGRVGSAVRRSARRARLRAGPGAAGTRAALRAGPRHRRASRERSSRAPGSRMSAARLRSRRSIRTRDASVSTPCRRSRCAAGRSSSTAPSPPSRPRVTERASIGFWLARTLGHPAVRARRRAPRRLPRRCCDRVQLPRHAATRGRLSARSCRRTSRRHSTR